MIPSCIPLEHGNIHVAVTYAFGRHWKICAKSEICAKIRVSLKNLREVSAFLTACSYAMVLLDTLHTPTAATSTVADALLYIGHRDGREYYHFGLSFSQGLSRGKQKAK